MILKLALLFVVISSELLPIENNDCLCGEKAVPKAAFSSIHPQQLPVCNLPVGERIDVKSGIIPPYINAEKSLPIGVEVFTNIWDKFTFADNNPPALSSSQIDKQVCEFGGGRAGEQKTISPLKLQVCWCPKGTFTMGSPKGEKGRYKDENQVEIKLQSGFWIGKYEVTQGLWKKVMNTSPWQIFPVPPLQGQVFVREGDDFPVTCVSYSDACLFCKKLSQIGHKEGWLPTGWLIQLPSEAQWEWACRAGTKTAYSFGNKKKSLKQYGWYFGNTWYHDEKYPHKVGGKLPNCWGLCDCHGNVWEWCLDWYIEDQTQNELEARKKPGYRLFRVFRGGCWSTPPKSCRSSSRGCFTPDYASGALGFRITILRPQLRQKPLETTSPRN